MKQTGLAFLSKGTIYIPSSVPTHKVLQGFCSLSFTPSSSASAFNAVASLLIVCMLSNPRTHAADLSHTKALLPSGPQVPRLTSLLTTLVKYLHVTVE